jgi:DNA invertase Pin-like site-specific DNA recombinase
VTPKAAAIYARISLDKNGDGLGVDRQIDLCRKLARGKGWKVAGVYPDNSISAMGEKVRPEYDRMLADVEAGTVDAVLCVDLDRLTRSPRELEAFMEVADRNGIALANVSGDTDLSSSDGRLKARILGAVARQESEKKSERMIRKFEQDARRGVPASGPRPFGYLDDRVSIHEDEAIVIKEMAERMLNGETAAVVARALNERGVPAPKSKHGWTASAVAKIVRSPRVAGLRAYKGEVIGELKVNGEPIQAPLNRSTWEQLNSRIRRTSRPGRPTAFLLAGGLARCAECGAPLWSSWANGKPRYVCPSRTGAGGCGKVAISAEPFEEMVARDVITVITGPKFASALRTAAGDDKARSKAARELTAAEERKTEMAGDYADGTISRREWMTARDRLDERIAAATKTLAADVGPLAGLPTTKKKLTDLWDAAPVDWRRAVLETVIDRIEIARAVRVGARFDEGRVTIRWKA